MLFAKLRIVRCFSSLGHLNDCECTNTLAQKRPETRRRVCSRCVSFFFNLPKLVPYFELGVSK